VAETEAEEPSRADDALAAAGPQPEPDPTVRPDEPTIEAAVAPADDELLPAAPPATSPQRPKRSRVARKP
jgi:hypothetical protein